MTPIQKQIQENFKMLEEMRRQLGIRPKMEVSQGGNKRSTNTFDLRSLNENLIKNGNYVLPDR